VGSQAIDKMKEPKAGEEEIGGEEGKRPYRRDKTDILAAQTYSCEENSNLMPLNGDGGSRTDKKRGPKRKKDGNGTPFQKTGASQRGRDRSSRERGGDEKGPGELS